MARYIDADSFYKLLKKRQDYFMRKRDKYLEGAMMGIIQLLEEQPTADVAPVVYAHWNLKERTPYGSVYYCSKCGERLDSRLKGPKLIKEYPYCHCGAKMEEE